MRQENPNSQYRSADPHSERLYGTRRRTSSSAGEIHGIFRAANLTASTNKADVIIDTQWDDYNIYEFVPDWMGSTFCKYVLVPGQNMEIEA